MSANALQQVRLRFSAEILEEACRRFGFDPATLAQQDGSAFVYEGRRGGRSAILKITPGLLDPPEAILGATLEQLLGELDFVRYLDRNGVPVALPLPGCGGEWVESIPLDSQACFLVYAFEKAPGCLYPDEDELDFPEPVLMEWGRLLGWIHRLSVSYRPANPAWSRPGWEADDLLEPRGLIPADQPLVWQRIQEIRTRLQALPRLPEEYGLVHGDFHHGNFLHDNGRLIAFDFDAAHHFWYAGDLAIALYNCLPMPRSKTTRRRAFSLHFLTHVLAGYGQERRLGAEWIDRLPLFLKFNEVLDYAHHHKYWDLARLSDRRRAILADMRRRIENEIPVVEFKAADLQQLGSPGIPPGGAPAAGAKTEAE